MKEAIKNNEFSEELEQLSRLNSHNLLTELIVQLWQFMNQSYTAYRQSLWLRQRQRTRTHLQGLTDEQLKDIGISREAAQKEANKFFWE